MKASKKLILLGSAIIIVDILYNLKTGSNIETLDTMLLFLGISMISLSMKSNGISSLGEFGVYFSFFAALVLPVTYVYLK